MTQVPQNKSIDRSSRAQARLTAHDERKRLALIDGLQRCRQRTEAVLSDLKNVAALLDHSIQTELQNSPTRDHHDPAFSMVARSLITRRENLRATIETLSEELASNNHSNEQ